MGYGAYPYGYPSGGKRAGRSLLNLFGVLANSGALGSTTPTYDVNTAAFQKAAFDNASALPQTSPVAAGVSDLGASFRTGGAPIIDYSATTAQDFVPSGRYKSTGWQDVLTGGRAGAQAMEANLALDRLAASQRFEAAQQAKQFDYSKALEQLVTQEAIKRAAGAQEVSLKPYLGQEPNTSFPGYIPESSLVPGASDIQKAAFNKNALEALRLYSLANAQTAGANATKLGVPVAGLKDLLGPQMVAARTGLEAEAAKSREGQAISEAFLNLPLNVRNEIANAVKVKSGTIDLAPTTTAIIPGRGTQFGLVPHEQITVEGGFTNPETGELMGGKPVVTRGYTERPPRLTGAALENFNRLNQQTGATGPSSVKPSLPSQNTTPVAPSGTSPITDAVVKPPTVEARPFDINRLKTDLAPTPEFQTQLKIISGLEREIATAKKNLDKATTPEQKALYQQVITGLQEQLNNLLKTKTGRPFAPVPLDKSLQAPTPTFKRAY